MKEYIGTKIVKAEPALRCQLLDGNVSIIPYDQIHENGPVDAVACEDGYKVVYQDGYESWSPRDVFEATYRETSSMTKIDRILSGDKDTLVNEIRDIVKWAREMSKEEWYNITHDADGGLLGVIRRIVEQQLVDTTDKEIPL